MSRREVACLSPSSPWRWGRHVI